MIPVSRDWDGKLSLLAVGRAGPALPYWQPMLCSASYPKAKFGRDLVEEKEQQIGVTIGRCSCFTVLVRAPNGQGGVSDFQHEHK